MLAHMPTPISTSGTVPRPTARPGTRHVPYSGGTTATSPTTPSRERKAMKEHKLRGERRCASVPEERSPGDGPKKDVSTRGPDVLHESAFGSEPSLGSPDGQTRRRGSPLTPNALGWEEILVSFGEAGRQGARRFRRWISQTKIRNKLLLETRRFCKRPSDSRSIASKGNSRLTMESSLAL